MRVGGPTRIGAINPSCAASTTPSIEIRSQGCATAVVTGGSCFAALTSRLYRSRGSPGWVSMAARILRCLVPPDFGTRTGENGFDAFEPPAPLLRQCAARGKHPAHQAQSLLALLPVVGQQLRKRRDGSFRVQ